MTAEDVLVEVIHGLLDRKMISECSMQKHFEKFSVPDCNNPNGPVFVRRRETGRITVQITFEDRPYK